MGDADNGLYCLQSCMQSVPPICWWGLSLPTWGMGWLIWMNGQINHRWCFEHLRVHPMEKSYALSTPSEIISLGRQLWVSKVATASISLKLLLYIISISLMSLYNISGLAVESSNARRSYCSRVLIMSSWTLGTETLIPGEAIPSYILQH